MSESVISIDVVVPLYNKEETIEHCLDSIAAQHYAANNIIVVDDRSLDYSAQVVVKYQSEHPQLPVTLIKQDKNEGESAARNTGIKNATSPYIAFLDADDWWRPQHLRVISQLIADYPCACVYSTISLDFWSERKISLPSYRAVPVGRGILGSFHKAAALGRSPLNSSTTCVKKTSLDAIGGFDEQARFGSDQICWSRLACRESIAWAPVSSAVRNHVAPNRSRGERLKTVRRWKYLDYYLEDMALVRANKERVWLFLYVLSHLLRSARVALVNKKIMQALSACRDCLVVCVECSVFTLRR